MQGSIATKEIKVGLAVIAVLSVALTWVVARRFLRTADAPPATVELRTDRLAQTNPAKLQTPEPQPMILPSSNRYTGPASFLEPNPLSPEGTLAPVPPVEEEQDGPGRSILPALPIKDRPDRTAILPDAAPLSLAVPPVEIVPTEDPIPASATAGSSSSAAEQPSIRVPENTESEITEIETPGVETIAPILLTAQQTSPNTEAPWHDPQLSSHVVKNTTTLWGIAESSYGSGAFVRALAQHNRKRLEPGSHLQPGAEILTPSIAVLRKLYPSLCPNKNTIAAGKPEILPANYDALHSGRRYLVEEGDTLSVIAKFELGSQERWPEIFYLNRGQLGHGFEPLKPGMWLLLPGDKNAVATKATESTQR